MKVNLYVLGQYQGVKEISNDSFLATISHVGVTPAVLQKLRDMEDEINAIGGPGTCTVTQREGRLNESVSRRSVRIHWTGRI